jgi:hypothetical protein
MPVPTTISLEARYIVPLNQTEPRPRATSSGHRLQPCQHTLDPSEASGPGVEEDANLESPSTGYSDAVIPTEGPLFSADRSGGIKARSQPKQHVAVATAISKSKERAGNL